MRWPFSHKARTVRRTAAVQSGTSSLCPVLIQQRLGREPEGGSPVHEPTPPDVVHEWRAQMGREGALLELADVPVQRRDRVLGEEPGERADEVFRPASSSWSGRRCRQTRVLSLVEYGAAQQGVEAGDIVG